ncbi:hypothetical protein TNCV_4694461 [Trichonephila clavipes]|nr:hypothetical protein TNCV_4694461 [Trichonephila clavipes]
MLNRTDQIFYQTILQRKTKLHDSSPLHVFYFAIPLFFSPWYAGKRRKRKLGAVYKKASTPSRVDRGRTKQSEVEKCVSTTILESCAASPTAMKGRLGGQMKIGSVKSLSRGDNAVASPTCLSRRLSPQQPQKSTLI